MFDVRTMLDFIGVGAIGSIIAADVATAIVRPHVKRVGGLLFFRFGRFGGSFYVAKRKESDNV